MWFRETAIQNEVRVVTWDLMRLSDNAVRFYPIAFMVFEFIFPINFLIIKIVIV